jgi:DNA-binding transcriptional MerR regulator
VLEDQSVSTLSQAFDNINSIPKIENLRLTLSEPRFLLRDTGISARVLSHWKKMGLLKSTDSEIQLWTRFSFIDYILLKIIQQMRMFGVSIKTIKSISSKLSEPLLEKINQKEANKLISKLKSYFKDGGFTKEEQKAIDEMSSRPDALLHLIENSPSMIDSIVANVIIKRQEAGFFLSHDGSFKVFLEEEKGKNPVETFFFIHICTSP